MHSKITRSTLGLRQAIFDELDKVLAGESTPARANVVIKGASQIIAISNMELDYARFLASMGKAGLQPQMPEPLMLGN